MNHSSRITHHDIPISVVIPVRNGGPDFQRCLDALRACIPPPGEVIVVDDGSTDGSAQVARERGAHVLSTAQPGSGPASARNLGAQAASGEVLLFVDADVAVHPDVVGRLARNFERDPGLTACFGSYNAAPAAPNFLSQYKNLFHHFVHQSARADASTFWAGCGAIRRQAFLAAGGFSPRYTRPAIEDIELGYRLKAAGHQLRLDKDVQATHLKRWTLGSLLRSDILDRGAPWTRLILRGGPFVDDLNLQTRNRVSVVTTYLLLIAMLIGAAWPPAWSVAGALALALLALNRQLYRFFAARRGGFFALRAIPMHWLYYFYNGVSFALGLGAHVVSSLRLRSRISHRATETQSAS
jgi:glycosyltransferase involved in cell wall biosynthesis